jgi:hypothetical protein
MKDDVAPGRTVSRDTVGKRVGLDGKDAEELRLLEALRAALSLVESYEGMTKELLSIANTLLDDTVGSKQSHRKRQARVRAKEIARLAAELKQQGVRDFANQAREELAAEWGFQSGQSLKKWFLRHR